MVMTITLRARSVKEQPTAGTFILSPNGKHAYRIASITNVRVAGDDRSHRYRLTCEPVSLESVGAGQLLPWPAIANPPPLAKRQLERPTADPGPAEPARARLDRIRSKAPVLLALAIAAIRAGRVSDEVSRLARVARVGKDDGIQDGHDHGPGIRLRPVRGRGNEIIREPDVEKEDGADPARPNRTVRRARRVDPLLALRRAATIDVRHVEATERLREQMEAAQPAMPGGGMSPVHLPGWQRTGFTDRQIDSTGAVRAALGAVVDVNRGPVLWVAVGGSVRGYASYARTDHTVASSRLRAGLGQLADHYYGPGGSEGRHR